MVGKKEKGRRAWEKGKGGRGMLDQSSSRPPQSHRLSTPNNFVIHPLEAAFLSASFPDHLTSASQIASQTLNCVDGKQMGCKVPVTLKTLQPIHDAFCSPILCLYFSFLCAFPLPGTFLLILFPFPYLLSPLFPSCPCPSVRSCRRSSPIRRLSIAP